MSLHYQTRKEEKQLDFLKEGGRRMSILPQRRPRRLDPAGYN
jgi:hypothetical protein